MAKEEDVLQANAGAPAADIPDLKKKDKERKKAGAAWSGARGGAGDFAGATGGGGARAAASAASASASSAAAEAALLGAEDLGGGGLWAALSRFFAGLTGTLLGKMAVAAAAFLLVGAAGLLGYSLMKGGGGASLGSPNLGGITDSMRVRAGGDDRLGVASKGELRFDPLSASKPAPTPPEAKKAEEKPAPDVKEKVDAAADKPVPAGELAHNLSGAKLSSSLGGDFGNKNIFAGNSAAPKFGQGIGAAGLKKFQGSKGQLGAMKASTVRGTPSQRSIGKASSQRAIGQLKMAKGMSMLGAQATSNEAASSAAQGAFDQQQTTGGNLATSGAPGGDTPNALGGGAPNTSMPGAPATPTTGGTDAGLQSALSQISSLANQAMSDMQTGMMELVLGAVLFAIGCCGIWTAYLIPIGLALMAMGYMEIQKAKQEEAQAMQMGQQLAQSIGNQQQGAAVNYCTQQAVNSGTPVSSCNPPDSVTNANAQSAQQQTDIQRVQAIPKDTPVLTK